MTVAELLVQCPGDSMPTISAAVNAGNTGRPH